jgi:aspartate ammonia-lyase
MGASNLPSSPGSADTAAKPHAVRQERDALGAVEVPFDALFGAQTQRGIANFGASNVRVSDAPELVRALAEVKIAAALANRALGALPSEVAGAIVEAGREVAAGRWNDQFPVSLVQGGGGTVTNMNMNEVLANRAGQLLGDVPGSYDQVHPNDHVNRSQSTNDVYPTALSIAVVRCSYDAAAALETLQAALTGQAERVVGVERLGRTCLRDALPVPISGPLNAQAAAFARRRRRLCQAADALLDVPLGGTAVGTGYGAQEGYRARVIEALGEETGLPVRPAADAFDALAHFDPYLEVADAVSTAMVVMAKIAADFRFLSSGPSAGIGELELPAVQVGSSCMPKKVNPVIPELVIQASFEVRAHRSAIEAAVSAGELELNVMEPAVARHLLEALRTTSRVATLFAERCVDGLEWDHETIARHMTASLRGGVDAALSAGYDAAAGK